MSTQKIGAIFLTALSLTACEVVPPAGGPLTGTTTATAADPVLTGITSALTGVTCHTDRFTQPDVKLTNKIDLLFVTDSSGSLLAERGNIADSIDRFVANLPRDADYQIAVMLGHGSRSKWSGRLYRAQNEPLVLSSQTMSLSAIRSALKLKLRRPRMDIFSDGGEEGLYSLNKLFTDAGRFTEARLANFLRLDSALNVVFISDENDICAQYPAGVKRVRDPEHLEEFAYFLDCVTPHLNLSFSHPITWETKVSPSIVYNRIKTVWGDRPLMISGIVYNNLATVVHKGQNEYAYGYLDLIRKNGDNSVDLGGGHITEGLEDLGEWASSRMTINSDFALTHDKVDPSTIFVTVDGARAAFQYSNDTHHVLIPDGGRSHSNVEINYCVYAPAPTTPGTGSGDTGGTTGGGTTGGGDTGTGGSGGGTTGGGTGSGGTTGGGTSGGDTGTGGGTGGGDPVTTDPGTLPGTGSGTTDPGPGDTGGGVTVPPTGDPVPNVPVDPGTGGLPGTGGDIDPGQCTAAECSGVGI